MEYIDCKSIAQKWKDEIKAHGIKAKFYVLQVGDNPASTAYIKGKIMRILNFRIEPLCGVLGMISFLLSLLN